jgi:hypothetical protein
LGERKNNKIRKTKKMTQITEKMLLRLKSGKTIRVKSIGEDEKGRIVASINGTDTYKEMTACSLVLVSDLQSKIESGDIKVVSLVWDPKEYKWNEVIS